MAANLVWVGIMLGVFASMTGTIGKQLLRFSELLKKRGLRHNSKVARGIGLALNTAVGPIVDMASYAFAPQSLIAPLGGLDVVWNTLSAPFTLGETLTKTVVLGVAMIAGGATGTSFFGNKDDKVYTTAMIKDTLARWQVLVYMIVLLIWLAFNILVLQKRSANPKGEPWATGDPIRGLSLGMTAGSISGNMFCVKGFIELVEASIRDEDSSIWADYLPYILLVGAIVFAVCNVFFLDKATRQYNALFMGAVFEGSLIVCAAVSGIIVYSDLDHVEWSSRILYFSCLGCIVAGVLIVAHASSKDHLEELQTQCDIAICATPSRSQVFRETPSSPSSTTARKITKMRGQFLFDLEDPDNNNQANNGALEKNPSFHLPTLPEEPDASVLGDPIGDLGDKDKENPSSEALPHVEDVKSVPRTWI